MIRRKKQIVKLGGKIKGDGYGSDDQGKAAYMLLFEIEGERFKVVWPVLQSKGKNEKAAMRQAATMLYHDVKAKCLSALVWGPRAAFFQYLLLPNGVTAAELSTPELLEFVPEVLHGRRVDRIEQDNIINVEE